jgi:hypothetical protein
MTERPQPSGFQIPFGDGEAQCFLLNDWKLMAHIVVDYRLLLAWASQAEVLYATASISTSTAEATAAVAVAAQQAALAREQAAVLRAEDERHRAKRLAWLAGSLGVVAVILGGVVVGVVVTR